MFLYEYGAFPPAYSTIPNRCKGSINSVGRDFSKNVINILENIDQNNSIGAFFHDKSGTIGAKIVSKMQKLVKIMLYHDLNKV